MSSNVSRPSYTPSGRVVQFVSDLVFGDAVASDCAAFHRVFTEWGWNAEIYAGRRDTVYQSLADHVDDYTPRPGDLIFFHYSGWSRAAERLLALGLPICLVYHNITPVEFLATADPAAAEHARRGLAALPELAKITALGLGVSEFNRQELIKAGFQRTGVLPFRVDFTRINGTPSARIGELAKLPYQILMVGRVVPNKCQHEAVAVLAALRREIPGAQLSIVGAHDATGPYCTYIEMLADSLGVSDGVRFTGQVPDDDLVAFLRTADVLLTLSEHEGFCVPLVEAMHLGLPVVAYASSAVPDTLGDAGILLHRKDPEVIAALLIEIHRDPSLRRRLVERGRARARDFSTDVIDRQLAAYVQELERMTQR